MSEDVKRMRSPEVMELIDSGDVKSFTNYIQKEHIRPKAIRHLFTKGSPKMISAYVNSVFPCSEEFLTYQKQVMRYGNRKTLATYYIYFNVEKDGEIELIDRNDINAFAFYLNGHELTYEAFKHLIDKGSSELIECFINNNSLVGKRLKYFLRYAKLDDIYWYYVNATNCEREVMADELREMEKTNHTRFIKIRHYNQNFELYL